MNAAETISAAMEKLGTLRAESVPGQWYAHENILGQVRVRVVDQVIAEVYDDDETANAELIVTLHRTIDAQFAVLSRARANEMVRETSGWCEPIWALGMELAEAILGVES